MFKYLAKPWFLECMFFFATLWQESFRLSARTSGLRLPVSVQLQNFYYFNFGDFVNGYVLAFLIDGVTNLMFLKHRQSYIALGFKINQKLIALLSVLLTSCIVILFELMPSASTTSDPNDIPAGLCGAFFYFMIRRFALKLMIKHRMPVP